jgi:hypothetical protein
MIQGMDKMINLTNTRNSWAEYLNKFQWEWYFTLTFDKKTSIRTAYRKFYKWKNWLKKALGDRVRYFLIAEQPRYKGDNIHFHGFIQGVKDEKPYKWKQSWHSLSGISDIQSYDKTQGASYYLSDKIVYKESDIRHSQDLNEIKSNKD